MAARKSASVLPLALAIATLTVMAYVSTQATAEAAQESGGVHGRRLLYRSLDGIEPRPPQIFSKVAANRVKTFSLPGKEHFGESLHGSFSSRIWASQVGEDSDYGPPHTNPPIHVDPPGTPLISNSVYKTLNRQLDTSANVYEDYTPATSNPPIDNHDYPPPKTWSSEASFMHATLPPPTITYHPENLSGN